MFLLVTLLVLCTRASCKWVGNDRQAIAIELTSRLGEDKVEAGKLKNVINLTLPNPFTNENMERLKAFIAGDKGVEGEIFNYKYSVTPQKNRPRDPDSEPK